MDRDQFREALLGVMERKQHAAWHKFKGEVAADSLHIHFEQEYATYVRDFPVMVGWAYVQCPIAMVRRELAENLYEEETGGIAAGRPHPELFLEYPKGLDMDMARFDQVELLDGAAAYRAVLDELTQRSGWDVAAAVATIFIEGTAFERGELDPDAPKRPQPPLEEHPLVVHYGLPLEALALTKAHRQVEGGHREAAWRCVLGHTPAARYQIVVDAMERTRDAWRGYRDDVARACGV